MSLEKIKKAKTLHEFADLLGFRPKALSFILYKLDNKHKYVEFEIPKKSGKARKISSPTEKLKNLQYRLAYLLNSCYEEINASKKSLSHGFRKNHSIVTNALKHQNKRYVFNIDLKDFFPSINFGRVRGFFIKNNNFQLDENIATIIAQIACYNNELPQGSPCSPVISNFIGHLLDIRMVGLAKKAKCTYSRYADDLTFSTNKKTFPKEIAYVNGSNSWVAGKVLEREIEKVGFYINHSKTSMQYKTSRQIATGLVINKKVNIRKEYYKNARAMCHSLFVSNTFYIDDKTKETTLNQLEGILSFIYKIKRPNEINEHKQYRPKGISKLYKSYLFYKYFFVLKAPLILTEGKTDVVYLKCALKQLAKSFNNLIEITEDRSKFRIKFFNLSKNFKDVFVMPKGTSGLRYLMQIYDKQMSLFQNDGMLFPVIIIIDNDSGAKEIKNDIKKKLNFKTLDKTYYNYTKNLYVLIVPNIENQAIEDLFENKILSTKIDGKKFNRAKEININKEYGKNIFAQKVIKNNQQKIDFSGFKNVFNDINAIIDEYTNKIYK